MLSSLDNNGLDYESKVEYLGGIRIKSKGSSVLLNNDRSQETGINNRFHWLDYLGIRRRRPDVSW